MSLCKFLVSMLVFSGATSFAATGEKVFFISPKDGATVDQKFTMKFGEKGVHVEKAGVKPDDKSYGHFHVLVDQDFTPAGQVIPADATHVHYGKGQKEGELTLTPGTHKLTLQFADGAHRSEGQDLSQTITVHVK